MSNRFNRSISEATSLTRAGKLHEATAKIMAALSGGTTKPSPPPAEDFIETSYTRLDDVEPAPEVRRAASTDPTGRQPLSRTLRALAQLRPQRQKQQRSSVLDTPPGAQFLQLSHSSEHGARTYRLYIPGLRTDGPMPVLLMLHGCTQSAEDFAVGTNMNALAEEFGFIVAYPEQPTSANMQKCWNWFRPGDQTRGMGEPALLVAIIKEVIKTHSGDASRVFAAGLSAGGAAAAVLGATYPDVFRAIGVHSGLAVGSAHDVSQALAAMRGAGSKATKIAPVRTIVFHGTADKTVHPVNATQVMTQALGGQKGLTKTERRGTSEGSRAYRQTQYRTPDGLVGESWEIDGAAHAWSGGNPGGTYTDPAGPDASRQMIRFFLEQMRAAG